MTKLFEKEWYFKYGYYQFLTINKYNLQYVNDISLNFFDKWFNKY
jgi:hypothetical protein